MVANGRYCSNLYPKAESYRICNWCLTEKDISSSHTDEQKLSAQNSSCSSKNDIESEDVRSSKKLMITRSDDLDNRLNRSNRSAVNSQSQRRHTDLVVQVNGSGEKSRSMTVRKRIITRGALEEKLRRTNSEDVVSNKRNIKMEINNNGNYSDNNSVITRRVYRNKARRYKLLDEVSS